MTVDEILESCNDPISKMDPDAVICAVFDAPGFIEVFYAHDNVYYSLDYLSEYATNGADSDALAAIGTAKPDIPGGTWYTVNP